MPARRVVCRAGRADTGEGLAHGGRIAVEGALHEPEQVRDSGSEPSPQVPQGLVRVSVVPIAHSPSSLHAHAPHVQSTPHVRAWTPQRPQVPPISTVPIEHGPPPTHVPSSRQTPSSQTCVWVPQCMHGTVRGAVPGVQSQLVGAVHAAHTPSVQRSTPAAHDELHGRSAMRPTLALASYGERARRWLLGGQIVFAIVVQSLLSTGW